MPNEPEHAPTNEHAENNTTGPPKDLKPVTLTQVRKSFNQIAGKSIDEIANGLVDAAKQGKVMSARYLLEIAGIYPVPDESSGEIEEGSLAATLLKYLNLPTAPEAAAEAVEKERVARTQPNPPDTVK